MIYTGVIDYDYLGFINQIIDARSSAGRRALKRSTCYLVLSLYFPA